MDLLANIGDRVFFSFDSAMLTKDKCSTITGPEALQIWTPHGPACGKIVASETLLNRQAAWLAKYPSNKILIAGNADERGTETYNLALGLKRADAARDYLIANGVAPNHIKTISYGKDRPVAAGHDEAAWAQNRNAITSVQGFNPQSP